MSNSYLLEIKKLRKRLRGFLSIASEEKLIAALNDIELSIEHLKALEKEQYLPMRGSQIHFLSDAYLYKWICRLKGKGVRENQEETSFMVEELEQYLELPELLAETFRLTDGEVFYGTALRVLEYCYCVGRSAEFKDLARIMIKAGKIPVFPTFLNVEKTWEPIIGFDEEERMYYYVDPIHSPKLPIYLPASVYDTEKMARDYAITLMREQDVQSPHCYMNERMNIPDGAVVIDAGVAEGNFTAAFIERVSRVYLVECDDIWINALKITFRKYLDKIVFVNKYLGSMDDDEHITIDTLLSGEKVDYIKMDIEGAELSALCGAEYTLTLCDELKCNICVYHRFYHNEMIWELLEGYDFDCENTEGFMCFPDDEFPQYPRRGLLQAVKRKEKKIL